MEENKELKVEEVVEEQKEEKKKDHKALIIILILLLLLSLGAYFIIKAKYENTDPDIDLVKIMNECYDKYKPATDEHKAHQIISSIGYIPERGLVLQENRCVAWDSKNDVFVLLENDTIIYTPAKESGQGEQLWIYTLKVPEASKFSIFWCGTEKVTKDEVVGQDKDGKDIIQSKDYYYSDHDYTKLVVGDKATYLCEECGHTYSVTRK